MLSYILAHVYNAAAHEKNIGVALNVHSNSHDLFSSALKLSADHLSQTYLLQKWPFLQIQQFTNSIPNMHFTQIARIYFMGVGECRIAKMF